MAYNQRTSVSYAGGSGADPDFIYYNADIVNNSVQDLAFAVPDPELKFDDGRTSTLIANPQDYQFSIIRFTMDGANLDLPMFIPEIAEQIEAPDYNAKTAYSVGFQVDYNDVVYTSQATTFPTVPRPAVGNTASGYVYQIVALNGTDFTLYGSPTNLPGQIFTASGAVTTGGGTVLGLNQTPGTNALYWTAVVPQPVQQINQTTYSVAIPYKQTFQIGAGTPFTIESAPSPTFIQWAPQNINTIIAPPPNRAPSVSNPQNYNARYYWCNTYDHWLTLVNQAINNALVAVYLDCFDPTNSSNKWLTNGGTVGNNPFPTFASFVAQQFAPYMTYSQNYFTLYGDVRAFGENLGATTYTYGTVTATNPQMKLFFNNNMYGLFSNFPNLYWNSVAPLQGFLPVPSFFTIPTPPGYVYEILFPNYNYTNILDLSGATPPHYVPTADRQVYWINKQEYTSIDTLWSPISSLVFTSSSLCVRPEATSAPLEVGTGTEGNVSTSNPSSNSPFQNIITDIALPMSNGAQDYRQFIYYAPTAQYRYSSFNTTQSINRVDIRVFWKNRFTNELFPIQMFNSSSVSIKMLFRKKSIANEKY
jgi:hypothetical protein